MSRGAHEQPLIVADGSNVALTEKTLEGKGKIETLVNLYRMLEPSYRVIIITDADLRYHVDRQDEYDKLEDEGIIHQAPAGVQADYFILKTAREMRGWILSNDEFRDWHDEFGDVVHRRIPFMVLNDHIELDSRKLPIRGKAA